jgi:hypothetical protein
MKPSAPFRAPAAIAIAGEASIRTVRAEAKAGN